MTRDDIIHMYKKANGWNPAECHETVNELERFASLVAAAEREACAKVAEWVLKMPENDVSAFIRTRGQV